MVYGCFVLCMCFVCLIFICCLSLMMFVWIFWLLNVFDGLLTFVLWFYGLLLLIFCVGLLYIVWVCLLFCFVYIWLDVCLFGLICFSYFADYVLIVCCLLSDAWWMFVVYSGLNCLFALINYNYFAWVFVGVAIDLTIAYYFLLFALANVLF